MSARFVLRAAERGFSRLVSTGVNATYVAGHPDGVITRHSSFNFHEYQSGIAGFGCIRVFGDEVFSPGGTGYNMHPHHNFIIMAFVLGGALTHINTIGKVDELKANDYYVFSAGAGGNAGSEPAFCASASGRAGSGGTPVGRAPVVVGSEGADGLDSAPGVDCSGCVACAICACGLLALSLATDRADTASPIATIAEANIRSFL